MPTTTNVEKVKLNLMTTAQYTAATKDPNQLYMVTDAQISYNDLTNKPNLATVATTGSYNDLTNKPTIPTVYNATLTIQKNGTTVKTFTANASSNVTCNITVPTDTSDLTNGAGYTTNVGTVTSVNNVSPVNGNVTLSIPSEVTETTVSNWGFTKNVGTVTSVNNVSPVNGNVTLSIPSIDNLANKDLSNLSTTGNSKFQEPLVSGTNIKTINNTSILGSGNISIESLPSQSGQSGKYLTTNGTTASWGIPKTFDLLDWKWSDHELSDQSWLNADTFSWQDGTSYSEAYNHLVADMTLGAGAELKTETIGSYTVSYYLASDGHKIVMQDQETTVANIYNETGVAWYYVLDTTNQRFKLPRTKYGVTGYRDAVGNYVQAGLPNITGNSYDYISSSNLSNATNSSSGALTCGNSRAGWKTSWANTTSSTGNSLSFDASLSNSIYGNSTTVQPPATQMYLYFYVGQHSQTATEQTAGLNAELFNGKVDLDGNNATFSHVVESYENGSSWYRVYSDGWCEQGGITGTESTTRGQTINISFIRQFNDTNYTIIATDGNTSKTTYSASVGIASVLNGTKTTSGVSISSYGFASTDTHGVISWIAYGKVF